MLRSFLIALVLLCLLPITTIAKASHHSIAESSVNSAATLAATEEAPAATPDAFSQRELSIKLSGDFTTEAVLTTPTTGSGPFPVLILFHGSGPYDMDATYRANAASPVLSTNFKLIAETLPASGFAVLRFNKRGVKADRSIDQAQAQKATLDQLVSDANAVIDEALKQPEVDKKRVFLYGWSEGTVVAANVATSRQDIAGLVLQGAPTNDLVDVLPYQWKEIALPYFKDKVDTDKDGKLTLKEVAAIPAGPVQYMSMFFLYDRASTPDKPLINSYVDADKDGSIDIDKELAPAIDMFLTQMKNYSQPTKASYKTDELVTAFGKPTLILQGKLDGWVPYTLSKAFKGDKVEVKLYDKLGHALSENTEPAEDKFGVMDQQPLTDVVEWLTQQVK